MQIIILKIVFYNGAWLSKVVGPTKKMTRRFFNTLFFLLGREKMQIIILIIAFFSDNDYDAWLSCRVHSDFWRDFLFTSKIKNKNKNNNHVSDFFRFLRMWISITPDFWSFFLFTRKKKNANANKNNNRVSDFFPTLTTCPSRSLTMHIRVVDVVVVVDVGGGDEDGVMALLEEDGGRGVGRGGGRRRDGMTQRGGRRTVIIRGGGGLINIYKDQKTNGNETNKQKMLRLKLEIKYDKVTHR